MDTEGFELGPQSPDMGVDRALIDLGRVDIEHVRMFSTRFTHNNDEGSGFQ